MKHPLLAILLFPLAAGLAIEPGFYSGFEEDQHGFRAVWEESERADHRVSYRHDGALDIETGQRAEERKGFLTLTEAKPYFAGQKDKNFLVLTFEKSVHTEEQRLATLAVLERYFFDLGCRRILFLGALGSGVLVYKDSHHPGLTTDSAAEKK